MERDLRLPLMAGIDIPIPELQTSIHPPKVKDIAYMGEMDFFLAAQYLCIKKEVLIQDKHVLEQVSNFQVLMKILDQSQKKSNLSTLLLLLFPQCASTFLPSSIILTSEGTTPVIIDENNFEILQEYVRQVLCLDSLFGHDNITYNPANEAARKIAEKIMKGRQKVAQLKSENGGNESVLTRYLSVLTVGISGMTLEDCLNLTLFQLFDLMERYSAFIEWDLDTKVRLAGGKPDKTVDSWMRDLHSMGNIKTL